MNSNPLRDAGFQEEFFEVERLSKLFYETERDYPIIHSICSDQHYKPMHNVLTWVETPLKNAMLGDIRIARKDMNGRPMREYCVYIDVKYSRDWPCASISFRKYSDSPREDALRHICDLVGRDVKNDFWYMSIGTSGRRMFALTDIQDYIRNPANEEKLREVCKHGKWDNGQETWFMPLDKINVPSMSFPEWLTEELDPRIG